MKKVQNLNGFEGSSGVKFEPFERLNLLNFFL
jgi:hypothetical protein